MVHATVENFEQLTKEGLVLVDFYAQWCGPCKMLGPVLEEVANEDKDVTILKVDVDQQPALAQQFKVASIPTLFLFKDGQVIAQTMGFQPKPALVNFIAQGK